MSALSGAAAIAGIGATEFSKESGRSELQLSVEAVQHALADCGLTVGRRRRADHVHHGHLLGDRRRPRARRRGAAVLQPDQLRRRRRLRDGPAGRDGGRHRRRRRRRRLPRLQRALGEPVRPVLARRGHPGQHQRPRQRLDLPDGARHAGRHGRDAGPPLHARVRRHLGGLRPGRRRRPPARGHQPERVLLREADHARGPPGFPDDRRPAAPARLLPGERRRGGAGHHLGRAGPRPAPRRRPSSPPRRRGAAPTSS